jgi:hypothetical protein
VSENFGLSNVATTLVLVQRIETAFARLVHNYITFIYDGRGIRCPFELECIDDNAPILVTATMAFVKEWGGFLGSNQCFMPLKS